MKGVVLDTNVLVSAMLTPGGNEGRILRLALAGTFRLYASPAMMTEYHGVLQRPRFKIRPDTLIGLFKKLDSVVIILHPTRILSESPDESDNRFLECAETAQAEYLVTGNKRHFPKRWKLTRIVSAREFLEAEMSI